MLTSHITTASIFTQELGSMANFSYIIADKSTALATVIDPAWEVSKIIAVLTSIHKNLTGIANSLSL